MPRLMRCKYCGTLQDEPSGAKICVQCGGELVWEEPSPQGGSYVTAQLELDQIAAPAGQITERHLMLTVETPDVVPQHEQVKTKSGREALHFVAVLDVSGSMSGNKIQAAKQAVQDAVHRLQEGDVFTLVTFSTDVRCTLSAKRVDANLRRVIKSALDEIRAGGQTALCGGLERGIQEAAQALRATNLVLLLSDGQANVGETDIESVGRRAIEARAKGVTVSALGVGRDYNEALMAEIAIDGGGRFYHIADASQIAAYLTGELGEMASLAARNVVVTLDLPAGTSLQSLSAAYPVEGQSVSLGDIPVSTSLEVVLRVLLPPQQAGARLPIGGTLRYQSPAGNALSAALNRVTVRYDRESAFVLTEGVVKPTARRVLEHMRAASVLSTSRAAAKSVREAEQESKVALASMRAYARLMGQDDEAEETLAQGAEVLGFVAARSPAASAKAKAATHEAMRRQRGSKDFGET
jgi:Ca-activated chloride channel family protein